MATQASVSDGERRDASVLPEAEWFSGGPVPRLHMPPNQPFAGRVVRHGKTGWYSRVDYLSLVTVTSGQGILGCTDGRGRRPVFHALTPGRTFLLRPGDVTLFRGRDPEMVESAYIGFPVAAWHSFALLAGLDRRWETDPYPPHSLGTGVDPTTIAAFERAISRFFAGDPTSFDLLEFWMAVVPKVIPFAERRERGPGGAPAWLVDGLAAMDEEENLRGGVRRLLELTHVSSSHLAACTRRFYGHTPTELVAELRLHRATELLRLTDAGVGEIARRCGFSSLVYFSGRFRAAYGMSPRDYRQSLSTYGDIRDVDRDDSRIEVFRSS